MSYRTEGYNSMKWNWQLDKWPKFTYDSSIIEDLEKEFLQAVGGFSAVLKLLEGEEKKRFIVEILCSEGLKSAEIEGEILKQDSLQSSIQRHFGFISDRKSIPLREEGIGELMWNIYDSYKQPLTHSLLYDWHRLLMKNEYRISDIGKYRTHDEPMQIVSGRLDKRIVYFEAPPSKNLKNEMNRFIKWFNDSIREDSILARAAIIHLYFESIHPFEDGNGRLGRALVEKALSQSLKKPTLIAVSKIITKRKKEYYKALAQCNNTLNIDSWIKYFAKVIVDAQKESLKIINFLMAKSKLMNELKNKINERQEKVLLRMFSEGIDGFSGGLSADNYIAISKTTRATATRDLADLVKKQALKKTGQLRYTRYWLNIDI
ncbi:MAG: Adenosine monophosphate-protein transferase SoFic [Candidatus Anoxychlamydiales bacterium]|nr:Adenosine monophosphate-protein transferase SoFic [Candidatus Anoxychlamydiales bacterium]